MSEGLDYAGNKVGTGKTERNINMLPWTIALLALAALAVFSCVRIEILNARYGYYLPRDSSTDPGQWRVAARVTEAGWRQRMVWKDPTILTRPLTPAEQTEMNAFLTSNRNNAALNEAVSTFGCLQYPLIFVLLTGLPFAFVWHRRASWRIAIGIAFCLILVCGAMMIYRGYFTSQGW